MGKVIKEMDGWVREGDGPWKPAPGHNVYIVDSGVWPMLGMAPGGSMTIDISMFWKFARSQRRKLQSKNVERDARIRDLWEGNKTEGQIHQKLKNAYPHLTLGAVKSVLHRFRKMGMLSHRRN